jgi:hypothetical protein
MAGGRPKKEIDYKLVKELSDIQCTQEEIAGVLNISVRTLQRDDEFCRIYKNGMLNGKMSLRRMQWEAAQAGNTTMLVWLGKQYLGQREKHEVETNIKSNQFIDSLSKFVDKI